METFKWIALIDSFKSDITQGLVFKGWNIYHDQKNTFIRCWLQQYGINDFFFFFCLFRDLIKKFLVIDRARRLGNMKVSQLNSRSLSFSHTAAPFNFFYESVRIRPKNRILFPEPAWTRPWFMILEQYFPNHCSNRLIKLNIRMLLKKEDTDNSLAFLIQGQRDSKMQTVNNDWTFQCLPWGREYTLIHKAWL